MIKFFFIVLLPITFNSRMLMLLIQHIAFHIQFKLLALLNNSFTWCFLFPLVIVNSFFFIRRMFNPNRTISNFVRSVTVRRDEVDPSKRG